jgi:hypothetical protein
MQPVRPAHCAQQQASRCLPLPWRTGTLYAAPSNYLTLSDFFEWGESSGKINSMDFHEFSRRGVSRPLTPKSLRPKKEANKMIDCKTSAGMSILVQLGRFLFHKEFRLLFALSDCPSGSHFEISGHRCTAHHGFAGGEDESVSECRKLKKLPIGPLNVVKYGGSFSFIRRLP